MVKNQYLDIVFIFVCFLVIKIDRPQTRVTFPFG